MSELTADDTGLSISDPNTVINLETASTMEFESPMTFLRWNGEVLEQLVRITRMKNGLIVDGEEIWRPVPKK